MAVRQMGLVAMLILSMGTLPVWSATQKVVVAELFTATD